MSDRSLEFFVADILDSIAAIDQYIAGVRYEQFVANQEKIDAVVRRLEIIGEAAKHIPENIREQYSEIPWKSIVGLRNIVTHEYFGIDTSIIWTIITKDIVGIQHIFKKIQSGP